MRKIKSLVETIKNGGSAEHLILDISNVKDTQNKINQMDYFDILGAIVQVLRGTATL